MADADSNIIGQAIEKWVSELPWDSNGERNEGILGDWMAIACFVDVDSEGRPNANYYIAMRDGTLLPHVARGLIVQAKAELPGMRDDIE